jgi:saccharopine dehydrogenase (NAD+, L-lysine-forming)
VRYVFFYLKREISMSKVIVIGCGGVATVGIVKCCQHPEVFEELCIASRTVSKCDALKEKLQPNTKTKISTAQIDAYDFNALCKLFKEFKADMILNLGLPYQNLIIMDACLECGCHYLDTAAYEPENVDEPVWRKRYEQRVKEKNFHAYFDYSYQWEYRKKFEDAGLVCILGCGFDPGVTQAYVAYAKKHEFDTIDTLDILDCNGGTNPYPFATNFNPEINLREVSSPAAYMVDGKWITVPALSIKREYNFDEVGMKDMYLLHHEEIEAIGATFPEIKRIRFYMTFSQSYINHMMCLKDCGMLEAKPVIFEGREIIPIQFLKKMLPDPATLGAVTKGYTNIGCIFTGKKDGKEKKYYIYNCCSHEESYKETGLQGVSYTTGVPAMCGAMMVLTGKWNTPGVHTVEELNPDPFIEALDKYGLPKRESYNPVMVD